MANPRIIFTAPAEAKEALKRVSRKTSIPESDLLRMALLELLKKHGEKNVDVSVERGGYRERSES